MSRRNWMREALVAREHDHEMFTMERIISEWLEREQETEVYKLVHAHACRRLLLLIRDDRKKRLPDGLGLDLPLEGKSDGDRQRERVRRWMRQGYVD